MKPEVKSYTTTVVRALLRLRPANWPLKRAAQSPSPSKNQSSLPPHMAASAKHRLLSTQRGIRRASVRARQIPGSFFRREGRPSTDAILTARLTDRPCARSLRTECATKCR